MNKTEQITPRVFIIKDFDEIIDLIVSLNDCHQVIINLSNLELSSRYRIVDFLSGYIYARNGKRNKLEDNIYMFSI